MTLSPSACAGASVLEHDRASELVVAQGRAAQNFVAVAIMRTNMSWAAMAKIRALLREIMRTVMSGLAAKSCIACVLTVAAMNIMSGVALVS